MLGGLNLRFYAVIRDKTVLVKGVRIRNETDSNYRYNEDEQYDHLIEHLFRHYNARSHEIQVYIAKRGSKDRNAALKAAIEQARNVFREVFGFPMPGRYEVTIDSPKRIAGLQAADYFLWALQRHYERGDSRYLEYLWPKIGQIHDLDRIEGGRIGVAYGPNRSIFEVGDEP